MDFVIGSLTATVAIIAIIKFNRNLESTEE